MSDINLATVASKLILNFFLSTSWMTSKIKNTSFCTIDKHFIYNEILELGKYGVISETLCVSEWLLWAKSSAPSSKKFWKILKIIKYVERHSWFFSKFPLKMATYRAIWIFKNHFQGQIFAQKNLRKFVSILIGYLAQSTYISNFKPFGRIYAERKFL